MIANKNAIAKRQTTYENLKPLSTRIINHLDILGLDETTVNQAKSINRLIQGYSKKASKIQTEEEKSSETKSTSHQSYTQTAENFSKLLQLVSTVSAYNPNTKELKLAKLTTYYNALVASTQIVNRTEARLNTAMIKRNTILYKETSGLHDRAINVKKYVKSVYGANSPEYKKVVKINFTDKS